MVKGSISVFPLTLRQTYKDSGGIKSDKSDEWVVTMNWVIFKEHASFQKLSDAPNPTRMNAVPLVPQILSTPEVLWHQRVPKALKS